MDGPDHIYRSVNVAGLEQLGRNEEDVLGRPVADVQPELVSQGLVAVLDRVFATGSAVRRSRAAHPPRPKPGRHVGGLLLRRRLPAT